jgi:lauroyl/myristoyl acyltransferase
MNILHSIYPDMLDGKLSDQLAQAVMNAAENNDLNGLVNAYRASRNPANRNTAGGNTAIDRRRLQKAVNELQFLAKNRPDIMNILHSISPDMLDGKLSGQLAQAVLNAAENNDLNGLVNAYRASRNNRLS